MNASQHVVVGERSHTLKHVEAKCESSIKIMYCNARNVLPKIDALHVVVSVEEPDVICTVETWLSNDIDDIEIEIPRYDVVHKAWRRCVFLHQPHIISCEILTSMQSRVGVCLYIQV